MMASGIKFIVVTIRSAGIRIIRAEPAQCLSLYYITVPTIPAESTQDLSTLNGWAHSPSHHQLSCRTARIWRFKPPRKQTPANEFSWQQCHGNGLRFMVFHELQSDENSASGWGDKSILLNVALALRIETDFKRTYTRECQHQLSR